MHKTVVHSSSEFDFETNFCEILNPKSAALQETCTLKFKNARVVKQPLKTEWCLDQPDQVVPSQYHDVDDVEERVLDFLIVWEGGGGGGADREDDNPGRPSLPNPTGGGSLDKPPGWLHTNCNCNQKIHPYFSEIIENCSMMKLWLAIYQGQVMDRLHHQSPTLLTSSRLLIWGSPSTPKWYDPGFDRRVFHICASDDMKNIRLWPKSFMLRSQLEKLRRFRKQLSWQRHWCDKEKPRQMCQ